MSSHTLISVLVLIGALLPSSSAIALTSKQKETLAEIKSQLNRSKTLIASSRMTAESEAVSQ